jgi:hypothetical protein
MGVECGPHPPVVNRVGGSGTRDITHATVRAKRLGSVPATDGGYVTKRTRFTPGVHAGILSLFKDTVVETTLPDAYGGSSFPASSIQQGSAGKSDTEKVRTHHFQ